MALTDNVPADEVFSKLPDYGYSNEVSELIWLWYHPESCAEVPVKREKV
jgi:hypothetical protein